MLALIEGETLAEADGETLTDGDTLGETEALTPPDGEELGLTDGEIDGLTLADSLGCCVFSHPNAKSSTSAYGAADGLADGETLGDTDALADGLTLIDGDGLALSDTDGETLGLIDGETLAETFPSKFPAVKSSKVHTEPPTPNPIRVWVSRKYSEPMPDSTIVASGASEALSQFSTSYGAAFAVSFQTRTVVPVPVPVMVTANEVV
jgi:hypothetical protein